ncbi:stage II sporulation protein R [Chakrabartyella piscis]|uniref:stage II sporulation protein R n=1 Tax=Chakrabartyella piscis TaxID=2918914 RepID=UPI002958CA43|nr:stage II sporulation protein R [Chakrabartyella piscis]
MFQIWKKKALDLWQKEKWNYVMALTIGLCIFGGIMAEYTQAYSQTIQNGIATKVVRFHVLANSNTDADQELKLLVRDGVLETYGEMLATCETKAESLALLEAATVEICKLAQEIVVSEGYDYPVSVSLVREQFPMKQYDDLTFPSGIYDALRIEIGLAEGNNWWCVLYPQMCFVDATWGYMTEESNLRLENTLTNEEYLVVSALSQEEITPKIKFKVVELWQEMQNAI